MNELKIFENAEFGQVRTVQLNNKPYFCMVDICKSLDISNISQAKTRLKEDGVISNEVIDSLGRKQQANFINESNMYKLIFQSRKDSAERFTDWVTMEVLPAIRKHGAYAVDELLNNPDMAIKAFTALKEEREKNKTLQADNARMKPKEVFADAVSTSKCSILIGELAKLLKQNGYDTGEKRLFQWLRENNFLVKRKGTDFNAPTQKSMELGLFEVKETAITHSDGHTTINKTTKVTGKGQQYFINKFLGTSEKKAG